MVYQHFRVTGTDGHIMDVHVYPGPSNGGSQLARGDLGRAAVVGEMWGQSKVVWGHCWYGDSEARQDPRGGVASQEQFLQVTMHMLRSDIVLMSDLGS